MDSQVNKTIIEKATIKSVAIYKAIDMLPPPPFEDKFKKEILCQQNENTQNQNSEQCLNKPEQKTEPLQNDTMNETKIVNEPENWRSITDPKLRNKMRKKAYYEVNKDKIKSYREANKDKIKLREKAYREANKYKIKLKNKDYREANKDKIKAYLKANKDKIKLRDKSYRNYKIKTDIQYKLNRILRKRLHRALNGDYKSGSAVRDLGCSTDELKTYLESKFQPGMSWNNHGYYGWHIDHIKPLSSFDLTDRNQFLEACHYTNLQPLWAKDNLIKSNN